jgi:hypothetical protein
MKANDNVGEPTRCKRREERVNELLGDRERKLPVWIRAPKGGPEYWTGFGRSKLYELYALGKIESRSIREPGQIKGTRLFNLQSILDYIESCNTENRTEEVQQLVGAH